MRTSLKASRSDRSAARGRHGCVVIGPGECEADLRRVGQRQGQIFIRGKVVDQPETRSSNLIGRERAGRGDGLSLVPVPSRIRYRPGRQASGQWMLRDKENHAFVPFVACPQAARAPCRDRPRRDCSTAPRRIPFPATVARRERCRTVRYSAIDAPGFGGLGRPGSRSLNPPMSRRSSRLLTRTTS